MSRKKWALVLFFAAIFVWVAVEIEKSETEGRLTTTVNYGTQLWSLLIQWAEAHDGKFPDRLDQLVTDGFCDNTVFRTLSYQNTAPRWKYFGQGKSLGEEDVLILRSAERIKDAKHGLECDVEAFSKSVVRVVRVQT